LGSKVARGLRQKYPDSGAAFEEIGSIVSAACLAHDMGNPPFGHSGEKAIGTYFSEGEGQGMRELFSDKEWSDFVSFEGNANAFRLLAHRFHGRREGGFALTYSTLASIVKYPYASEFCPKGKQKFGFFQEDKPLYERIAADLGICRNPDDPNKYARYPLVYLVETADDICYEMMDLEDACKLHIVTFEKARDLYLGFFEGEHRARRLEHLKRVDDTNEQLAYLRSVVIGVLVDACAERFLAHEEDILSGRLVPSLVKLLPEHLSKAFKAVERVAQNKIYMSQPVLDIELGGYKVISELLRCYIDAVFAPEKTYSQRLLDRVPSQYEVRSEDNYTRVLAVLDYLSGMTDVYALDLYRMIMGISIPSL
jgi:dGTPase